MKNKILYFSFFILGAVSCLIANKLISPAQAYYGGCNCSYYDFQAMSKMLLIEHYLVIALVIMTYIILEAK